MQDLCLFCGWLIAHAWIHLIVRVLENRNPIATRDMRARYPIPKITVSRRWPVPAHVKRCKEDSAHKERAVRHKPGAHGRSYFFVCAISFTSFNMCW